MFSNLFELYLEYKMKRKKTIFGYHIMEMQEEPHIKKPVFGEKKIDRKRNKTIKITLQNF